jgi:hypothetical protein
VIYDIWYRRFGIPLQIFILSLLFNERSPLYFPFYIEFAFTIVMVFLIWITNRTVIYTLNRNYPWNESPWKRMTLQFLLNGSLAAIVVIPSSAIYLQITNQFIHNDKILSLTITGFLLAMLTNFYYEAFYLFTQWKKSLVLTEKFKNESVRSQLESLRNQINPHFLFNSLNTLSALINKDPDRAEEFVNELSEVYRYVLNRLGNMMVTIEEELEFLSSYKYLLDTRHGGNIEIDIDIEAEFLQFDIPPMTLQLLIENAVKHNIVSKNKPLKIRIYNDADRYLVIQNNLQKKRVKPISTGIGLNNIRNRFEYLAKRTILVEEGESFFVVKLPLVKI